MSYVEDVIMADPCLYEDPNERKPKMAENIFAKFNKSIDVNGLKKDAEEVAKNGGGDFPEVPVGTYEVTLVQCELKASKKGLPMVAARFKIIEGQYKNSLLFYNQTIHTGFGLHKNNEFFDSMQLGLKIEFEDFEQYADLMLDAAEAAEGLTFALEYGENKGFPTFKIESVFED